MFYGKNREETLNYVGPITKLSLKKCRFITGHASNGTFSIEVYNFMKALLVTIIFDKPSEMAVWL